MVQSVVSPFGPLLAEMRERQMSARPAKGPAAPGPAQRGPEPDLWIETRVVSRPRRSGPAPTRWLWPASFLFHTALILAVVVGPLLLSEALPAPARSARVFFVGPASVALPPPPPAAAPPAAARRSEPRPPVQPTPPPSASFTAPAEVPEPVIAGLEPGPAGDGLPGGETGGVQGGVAGGIVGGVLGGVPELPPVPAVPIRVGGEVKEPKKLKHVNPVYPEVAVAARVRGSVILECIVNRQGRVTSVKVLRGIPLLDVAAVEAVKQWAYTPTLKDGVPVSVIMTVTVRFDL
jgi:protein TonB